jgi:hypothetical protein
MMARPHLSSGGAVMGYVHLVLILLAAICFFADAVGGAIPRLKLLPLGLFFWVLALLVLKP